MGSGWDSQVALWERQMVEPPALNEFMIAVYDGLNRAPVKIIRGRDQAKVYLSVLLYGPQQ